MGKLITVPLPQDLPENWNDSQYVSPGGTESGLTEQHGYNYLMKQVNAAQKAIQELDNAALISRRNLLHNWFFPMPVNTEGSYVALPGTPYYTASGLLTQAGTTTGYVKATYINNVYCTILVGNATYFVRTSACFLGYMGNGYVSINRWRLVDGTTQSYLRIHNDGILLNLGQTSGSFYQTLTIVTPTDLYMGLTFTASVRVESLAGGSPALQVRNGDNVISVPITQTGVTKLTIELTGDIGDYLEVALVNTSTSADCEIKAHSMKFEVGTASSLEEDAPADFAEQMAICVQYDQVTDQYVGFAALQTANILADAEVV